MSYAATSKDAPTTAPDSGPVVVRAHLMATIAVPARPGQHTPHGTQQTSGPRSQASLRTARLCLRPLLPSDRRDFLRVLRESRAYLDRFCPLDNTDAGRTMPDERIFARQLALSDAALATGRAWRTAAFDGRNRLVGAFNINDISRGLESSGEIVFWLAADSTGRGYAEEALRATLDHAFADLPRGLGLQRLTALIAPDNAPCLKLAGRIGFRRLAAQPVSLTLSGRAVSHDIFAAFAPVDRGVVEPKPSLAADLFGRGLLSILRTEATPQYPPADAT